jgi:DNA polymerase IV
VEETGGSGDFFAAGEARALVGEKAVDALRARFGPDAVVAARSLRGRAQTTRP